MKDAQAYLEPLLVWEWQDVERQLPLGLEVLGVFGPDRTTAQSRAKELGLEYAGVLQSGELTVLDESVSPVLQFRGLRAVRYPDIDYDISCCHPSRDRERRRRWRQWQAKPCCRSMWPSGTRRLGRQGLTTRSQTGRAPS